MGWGPQEVGRLNRLALGLVHEAGPGAEARDRQGLERRGRQGGPHLFSGVPSRSRVALVSLWGKTPHQAGRHIWACGGQQPGLPVCPFSTTCTMAGM